MAQRHPTLSQSYCTRSQDPQLAPLGMYLLRLMSLKASNLCVSADVSTTNELIDLAEEVGDYIVILKTHADIISDFSDMTIARLSQVAREKKFLIFEDRKFGDIGNTVQLQYSGGPLKISRWAPIVNAHIFPGPAVITSLKEAAQRAVSRLHTSFSTQISGGPSPTTAKCERDESDAEEEAEDEQSDISEPEDKSDVDGYSEDEDEPRLDGLTLGQQYNDIRDQRKQSVVSVTTEVSMTSEVLSPPPVMFRQDHHRRSTGGVSGDIIPNGINHDNDNHRSNHHHNNSSNNSEHEQHLNNDLHSDDDDEDDEDDRAQMWHHLNQMGHPPLYRSLLLLAQMSSANNYFTPTYTAACLTHAREHRDFVLGFIAQQTLNTSPEDNFITMTPGVQLERGGDGQGQQYNTPRKVIYEAGSDVIIVGRGILQAEDRRKAAMVYRNQGWEAYRARVRDGRKKPECGGGIHRAGAS